MLKFLLDFLPCFNYFLDWLPAEIPCLVISDGQRIHGFVLLIKLNQLIDLNMLISETVLPFNHFLLLGTLFFVIILRVLLRLFLLLLLLLLLQQHPLTRSPILLLDSLLFLYLFLFNLISAIPYFAQFNLSGFLQEFTLLLNFLHFTIDTL